MKCFDVHMHLNMKASDPLTDLFERMDAAGIDRAVLILNQNDEIDCFDTYIRQCNDQKIERLVIARILSPQTASEGMMQQKHWRERGVSVCTKIHPRISGLTREDIPAIESMLASDLSDTVIVDSFYFGQKLEQHFGIELAIRLAERFPKKNIVIAHAGGHRFTDCMLYTRPLKNIFYDLALTCTFFDGASVELDIVHFLKFTCDRIMCGSDYPEFAPQRAIIKTKGFCDSAGLTDIQTENVLYNNAIRAFCSVHDEY